MDYFNDPEFNDPELNGKYLGTITKDFVKVCDTLLEAAASYASTHDSFR